MKTNYNLFEILAYSSIHEALWGIMNVFVWSLVAGIGIEPVIYFYTFSVLFFIYSYNRISDIKGDEITASKRLEFVKKIGKLNIYVASIFFLLSTFLIYLTGNLIALTLYLFTILLGIIYSKGFLFIPKLKNVFLIKNISVGVMFCLAVIAVPFLLSNAPINIVFYLLIAYIFLRVFMNTTYFDIRDLEGDKATGAVTLPVKIGENNTTKFLNVINLASFVIILPVLKLSLNPHYVLFVMPAILGFIYINLPKNTFHKIIQFELIADGTDSYFYFIILAIIGILSAL